jgi:hypothetical protein
VELYGGSAPGVAVSPDGRRVAFVGLRAGVRQLYVRRLDEPQALAVRGLLPSGSCVFFSPGSDAVGVIQSDGEVIKVTLADNLVVSLAQGADYTMGATWTADGRVFIKNHSLWQVSAMGGAATPLLPLDGEKGEWLTPGRRSSVAPAPSCSLRSRGHDVTRTSKRCR